MAMTQRSARDLVTDIIAATTDGDPDAAVRAAAWGIEAFPDAAVFHRLRGVALAALGANEEAKADLNLALTVDPLDHEALVTLSRLEEAEGDFYTAAEHLLTAWEHDPANGLLRSDLTHRLAKLYGSEGYLQYTRPALAALYVRNAYPERAAREYAAALAEQPARVDLRLASVLARWRLGALTEATDGCVLLLNEQPQLVRARWALADALARRGKGEEAREHARHAALLDPDGAIARDLIAGNAEATIVDPDEMVRVSLDIVRSGPDVTTLDPYEMPPAVEVLPPIRRFAGAADATTGERDTATPFAAANLQTAHEAAPPDLAPAPHPFEEYVPVAPPPATPHEEPVSTTPPVPAPYTTDAAPPERDTPVLVPPQPDTDPEPITAIAADDGSVILMHPGDEPLLESADAQPPLMQPQSPEPPEPPEPPQPFEEYVPVAPPLAPPDAAHPVETVNAEVIPASPSQPEISDAPVSSPVTAATAPEASGASVPVGTPAAHVAAAAGPPARLAPPADLWPAMQARLAADDSAGALALGRASLAAAGKDTTQVRALLPALRSLADATPNRPEARRLLGDAYRRLGLMAQAQGQYQQALLVRVAGKK